jgi:hypothetical protein
MRSLGSSISPKIKTLAESKWRTLEEILREVARSRESMTVILEEGEVVNINPASQLKPLPELDGRLPEGWKDAVY